MASLARPSNDRVIAGVCSGFARRFGLSSNVVRLIFVLSMSLPGPQILIYLAGWRPIPDERSARSTDPDQLTPLLHRTLASPAGAKRLPDRSTAAKAARKIRTASAQCASTTARSGTALVPEQHRPG